MPEFTDWLDEPIIPQPDYSDLLIAPVGPPEPAPELTSPQRHDSGFRGESYQGDQLGGFQSPGSEPVPPMRYRDSHPTLQALGAPSQRVTEGSEVCVLTGWPRRHQYIGRHCPHGLADRMIGTERKDHAVPLPLVQEDQPQPE
jgi:hypothetical protein